MLTLQKAKPSMPSCDKLAAKGTQDHMARGRDWPFPKYPWDESSGQQCGRSQTAASDTEPALWGNRGAPGLSGSTVHKQFKRCYIANKNKIALYYKVLPHKHRVCSASRKCIQKVLLFKMHAERNLLKWTELQLPIWMLAIVSVCRSQSGLTPKWYFFSISPKETKV